MTSPIRRSRARTRRGRSLAVVAGMVVAGAALFVVLAVRLASSPEVNANLGDDEYDAGPARDRADEIERDNYPLLLPDLRNQGLEIWVNHLERDPAEGWVAFAARAPSAPRRCPLEWNRRRTLFVDSCDGRTFPADGTGLRQFAIRVEEGRLIIDLRRPPATTTTSTSTTSTSPAN